MKKAPIRYLIVIIITALAAALVIWADRISAIENKKFYDFPLVIGQWYGRQVPMEDYVYQSLETNYALLRNYSSPHYLLPVNLSIVWFDDRNISFHAPEACLGGVGNLVKTKGTTRVSLGHERDVGKLVVEQNGMRQVVIYFFDEDGYITMSQSALRLRVLMKRLRFKRSSVSFIRIMAPIAGSETETMSAIQAFLQEMYPLVPDYLYIDRATS
ncbi:MAG: hypothetical protein BWY45_02963 [Euryarchaeota archaeon ADurb.Bin294]|nr:MAG: hypothetical protein BWY45_02963 [Euryarchaeota archaeon ADurb.Bin294]